MPEGPSIIVFKEQLPDFENKTVTEASGYGEMPKERLQNIRLRRVDSFGKNLLFVFDGFFVSVHFGLFGRMLVNDRKKVNPSFALHFPDGEINFYVARTKLHEGAPESVYDFRTDIMRPEFDADYVQGLLKSNYAEANIGDALLDQNIFAGSGNIIRVDALYLSGIHPDSKIKDVPAAKLQEVIDTTVAVAQDFLLRIPLGTVKKEAAAYGKKNCPKHDIPLIVANPGKTKRKSYVCEKCQQRY
ncbi:MAG: endonuclease [Chryseobacterium sp.]|nr:MAG: endonuclease [Chryseobacterium sp.]